MREFERVSSSARSLCWWHWWRFDANQMSVENACVPNGNFYFDDFDCFSFRFGSRHYTAAHCPSHQIIITGLYVDFERDLECSRIAPVVWLGYSCVLSYDWIRTVSKVEYKFPLESLLSRVFTFECGQLKATRFPFLSRNRAKMLMYIMRIRYAWVSMVIQWMLLFQFPVYYIIYSYTESGANIFIFFYSKPYFAVQKEFGAEFSLHL